MQLWSKLCWRTVTELKISSYATIIVTEAKVVLAIYTYIEQK